MSPKIDFERQAGIIGMGHIVTKGTEPGASSQPRSPRANNTETAFKKWLSDDWVQVAGSFFPYLNSWGLLNCYGVFQAYYTTHLLPSVPASKLGWIGSMQAFLLLFVGVLIGPLIDAGYMRHVLAMGTFLVAFGMMMTSLCHTYWQFMLAQGIVVGLGSGCLFLTSITIVPQYYGPKHRSLVMGLVATAGSVGGFTYPIIFHYVLQDHGFGWGTRVIGFITLGTNMIGFLVLRMRTKPAVRRAFIKLSMFRETAYPLMCLAFFFGFMGIYNAIFYIDSYALQHTTTPPLVAFYLIPTLMLASAPGRIFPNLIADKIGNLNVLIPITFICGLLAFCWIAIQSVAGLVVFAVLYGFSSGAFVSLIPPAIVSTTPSMENLATRMGMGMTIVSFGAIIGNPTAGSILVRTGSYLGMQIFSGALLFLSLSLILLVRYIKVGWNLNIKV